MADINFVIDQSATTVTASGKEIDFTQSINGSITLDTAGKYVANNIKITAEKPEINIINNKCLNLSNFN